MSPSVTILSMRVFPSLERGKAFDVVWDVAVRDGGVPTYMLQTAEAEDGPWADLWDDPVSETMACGIGKRSLTAREHQYLRLGVFLDGVPFFKGAAMNPGTAMSRRDYLVYRDLLRRENLALVKKNGAEGWVVQKQVGGCPCPRCSDEILVTSVIDSNCEICLGTGKVGGYTVPRRVLIDWGASPKHSGTQRHGDAGIDETEVRNIRLYPFPSLAFKDIVVDSGNNNRFSVVSVRGVPWKTHIVAQLATVTMLPKADPAYKIPLL